MRYPRLLTPEEGLAAGKEHLGIPAVVAICGSTRFMAENEADLRETAACASRFPAWMRRQFRPAHQ